jgi:hypothetical protein
MHPAEGKYYIDGIDLWKAFGIFLESGTDDFLKFPAKKDGISHDWEDANGVDYDLSRVFFKDRTISLNAAIVADSKDAFWQQYNSFLAQIAQPGTHRLTIDELDNSFYIFYKECTSFTRFTRIKTPTGDKVGCKFIINVVEPAPAINNEDVYIVDDEGRYLIT